MTVGSAGEIGSEFPWSGVPAGPLLPWPEPHEFLSRGRDALLAAIEALLPPGRRLFVPEFFCPGVLDFVRDTGVELRGYVDDPRRATPDWSSLQAAPGDAVLAVNFFGARDGDGWERWRRENGDVHVLEDHTHDPLSPWARQSRADFAFASLRKTLPAPDGAILWSPAGRVLPAAPAGHDWTGSALKLAGMVLKRQFLHEGSGDAALRDDFRQLELKGERTLAATVPQAISPWSRVLVARGYAASWRQRRESNVQRFVELWRREVDSEQPVAPLFTRWARGHCPLNPVLVFADPALREACRRALIEARVFAPVHWPLDASAPRDAHELSQRILTVPLDHRCRAEDLPRIVACIRRALPSVLNGSLPA